MIEGVRVTRPYDMSTRNAPPEWALASAAAEGVATAFGLSRTELLERDRHPDRCEARAVLYKVLRRLGFGVVNIARYCHRDHGTVVYALAKTDSAGNRLLIGQIATSADCHQSDWALRPLPEGVRPAVRAYLRSLLDGRPAGHTAYAGLVYLALTPAARLSAYAYLADASESGHAWRIREHAHRAGLPWRESEG